VTAELNVGTCYAKVIRIYELVTGEIEMLQMNRTIAVGMFLWMACAGCTAANAQIPVEPAKQKKGTLVKYITVDGELTKIDGVYETTLHLGHLDVSSKVVVTMNLKNTSDSEIKFSDVSKKCSCSAFKAKDYVIPMGSSEEVKLTIKTPARWRTKLVTQAITFVDEGNAVVRADLTFNLNGLLAFKEPFSFVEFEADEEHKDLDLPFLLSDPVKLEDLQAKGTENLQDATFEFVAQGDGGVLKVGLSDKILVDGKITGEISISDSKSDGKDGCYVVVKDNAADEISPETLSFRETDGVASATAIVKIASRNVLPEKPITCSFDGQEIPLELKQLKKNTYRVKLKLDESLLEKMSKANTNSRSSAFVISK